MGAADSSTAAVIERVVGASDPRLQLLKVKMARMDRQLRVQV
jgi:hypothetical protein